MGRSVMTHSRAVETVYLHIETDEGEWGFFIDDLKDILQTAFPSLENCDVWEYRECHGILENGHARVFISEYCGCVAIELVPHEFNNGYSDEARSENAANHWCAQVSKKFREILEKAFSQSAMRSIGRASNGEQFFTTVESGVLSSVR